VWKGSFGVRWITGTCSCCFTRRRWLRTNRAFGKSPCQIVKHLCAAITVTCYSRSVVRLTVHISHTCTFIQNRILRHRLTGMMYYLRETWPNCTIAVHNKQTFPYSVRSLKLLVIRWFNYNKYNSQSKKQEFIPLFNTQ